MTARRVAVVVAAVLLLSAWSQGAFDRALVGVGLNAHECARTGLGVTLCGDELRDYWRRVVEPAERLQRELSRPRSPAVDEESPPCDPDGVYAERC